MNGSAPQNAPNDVNKGGGFDDYDDDDDEDLFKGTS